MSALVRTQIGPYRMENAVTLEQLTRDTLNASLLNPATAVTDLPRRVSTSDEEIALLRAGRAIPLCEVTGAADSDSVVVLDGAGALLALARPDDETNSLRPYRVFLD